MGRWFRDEWRWELRWRRGWFQWEHDLVQQLREDINMVVQAKEVVMVGVGLGEGRSNMWLNRTMIVCSL